MRWLVATDAAVLVLEEEGGTVLRGAGLEGQRPTCVATDPRRPERAWCGTDRGGVFRTADAGLTWHAAGMADRRIMALTASPAEDGVVWVGTEPSEVWRSGDGGDSWEPTRPLDALPSSGEWAFPPRPDTHHVRWIACHPQRPGWLWVAVEAGALVSTHDGGRTWHDRVPGGPFDTHELAVHPDAPDTLRVAAGDGYYESFDGGASWASPMHGFDVGYLRSVAIDPGDPATVVVSASSRPRTAYVAGHADGRLYRRSGDGDWQRVSHGWPDPPSTIAPLLLTGHRAGCLLAADERGVHRSDDGGVRWHIRAAFPTTPHHLRGVARFGD